MGLRDHGEEVPKCDGKLAISGQKRDTSKAAAQLPCVQITEVPGERQTGQLGAAITQVRKKRQGRL